MVLVLAWHGMAWHFASFCIVWFGLVLVVGLDFWQGDND